MSSQIFLPLDDTTPGLFSVTGNRSPSYGHYLQDYWGGSTRFFPPDDGNPTDSISFSFQGTVVALYGVTDIDNQNFSVSIDGGSPSATVTGDTNPPTYMQWYQSPTLPGGLHKVEIFCQKIMPRFDMILVTPDPNDNLAGQMVMVDDSFPSFSYHGSGWKTSTNTVFGADSDDIDGVHLNLKPFQNNTHQTSNPGDFFTFSFTGTRASIYGVQHEVVGGNISISYSIDSGSFTSSVLVPEHIAPSHNASDTINRMILDTGPLKAGNHTLLVNLTATPVNQPLIIDYALFTSSSLPPQDTPTPSHSPSPLSSPIRSGGTSATIRTTAIVAGVVGSLVLILVCAFVFIILRRRNYRFRIGRRQLTPIFRWATKSKEEIIIDDTPFRVIPPPLSSNEKQLQSIQEQIVDLQGIIARMDNSNKDTVNDPRSSRSERERTVRREGLLQQIEMLTRENERLASIADTVELPPYTLLNE